VAAPVRGCFAAALAAGALASSIPALGDKDRWAGHRHGCAPAPPVEPVSNKEEPKMSPLTADRRRFLQVAGGTAAVAAQAALLSACGDQSEPAAQDTSGATSGAPSGASSRPTSSSSTPGDSGSGSGTGKIQLPTYASHDVIKPDLPALDNGTPGGLLRYPSDLTKAYPDTPPAHGGAISILKMISNAPPPPLNKNKYWQELNKRVGAELKFTNVAAQYGAKLTTTIAGGDLPDLVQMQLSVPHLPDVLKAEFQDLSEWLAGDADKNYIGLPAMLPVSWKNVLLDNGIWGIPWQLGLPAAVCEIRQDIFDAKGLSPDITSGQDFLDLCKALTDHKKHWAIGGPATATNLVREMAGVPNQWREEDGAFTNMYETDEYKRSLDLNHSLWTAGYMVPESLSSAAGAAEWFASGRSAINAGGYTNWEAITAQNLPDNPDFRLGGIVPAKWDGGGQAAHWTGNGMYTFTALKKTTKARAEELLRVLDWFAAPFGSEEFTFRRYGILGHDYTMVDGAPTTNDTGANEVQHLNASYVAQCPLLLYIPGHEDATKDEYNFLSKLMKVTVDDPTIGLFSDTELTKGSTIKKAMQSLEKDIIFGHKPLSSWDDALRTWRSGGGDQIRKEYQEAYAKMHS
jgi:putative aldouronate transport system substrate-binding protein